MQKVWSKRKKKLKPVEFDFTTSPVLYPEKFVQWFSKEIFSTPSPSICHMTAQTEA